MRSFIILLFFLSPLSTYAQAEGFDPFVDYSEFEEATEEEADINFFQNGRFLTIGLVGGMRGYTGSYGSLIGTGSAFGLYLAFFFDLKFALQVSYVISSHEFDFTDQNAVNTGSLETTTTSFNFKYYFNSQNTTKGLGRFNPYVIGGLNQLFRTYKIDQVAADVRDGTTGFEGGLGFEIPFARNKSYLGLEAKYIFANFSDENTTLDLGATNTGFRLEGDAFQALVILGVNF